MYQDALQKSGFTERIKYITSDNIRESNTGDKKRRKRKIIWFNPPYSMDVRTNIGKTFLKSIRKHFPNGNSLHKIFNKNTFKVSYSCMCNMASIISSHNRTILNSDVSLEYGCNCRSRNECPLQNKCLTSKFASRADVENEINNKRKFYFWVSKTAFEERYRNHKKECNYVKYRNSTELFKCIWQLKDLNITPKIL